MTRQLQLPRLRDPQYHGPLTGIGGARGMLHLNEDQIGSMVDEGQLIAFDIRCPSADRRELRILTVSISEFLGNNPDRSPTYVSQISPEVAVALVLLKVKHDKPYLNRKEVSALLDCGRQHAINLFDSHALPELPGTTHRPGPNGSPIVARDAFKHFLATRLEGGL